MFVYALIIIVSSRIYKYMAYIKNKINNNMVLIRKKMNQNKYCTVQITFYVKKHSF